MKPGDCLTGSQSTFRLTLSYSFQVTRNKETSQWPGKGWLSRLGVLLPTVWSTELRHLHWLSHSHLALQFSNLWARDPGKTHSSWAVCCFHCCQ